MWIEVEVCACRSGEGPARLCGRRRGAGAAPVGVEKMEGF